MKRYIMISIIIGIIVFFISYLVFLDGASKNTIEYWENNDKYKTIYDLK